MSTPKALQTARSEMSGQERVRASYGRLAQIKATYYPTNLFRVNQKIEPNA
jgi:hypothetical protein